MAKEKVCVEATKLKAKVAISCCMKAKMNIASEKYNRKPSIIKQKTFNKGNKQSKNEIIAFQNIAKQIKPEQVIFLKNLFQKLDKDGSGSLSILEIKKGLYEIENGEALYDCIKSGDINGDGEISFDEFLTCAIDFNVFVLDEYLRKAFDHFDKDKSGGIDHEELFQLMSSDGKNLDIKCEDIHDTMEEFDKNGDGTIGFIEFKALMLQVMSRT